MTSTIKVNKIEKVDGSTIELGGPGTAVNLACGATQSGFGRTGTVDWCTTAKTSPFTATSGDGFFVNTTSGGVTVTLPSSPSAGDIVAIKDYAGTFNCNALTICRNGSKINGEAFNSTITTENLSVTLIYVDDTKGWQDIHDSTQAVTGASFIAATGGNITESGNFKIHTFTSSGTFCVSSLSNTPANNTVSYVVVAGGAGGGSNHGAGGGAGGFREGKHAPVDPYTASPLVAPAGITVTASAFPITVGAGGAKANVSPPTVVGGNGSPSIFSTITSTGGGGGGGSSGAAGNGGSGGGNGGENPSGFGSGNTPPVSPPQGNNGEENPGTRGPAGGGGGATQVGGVPGDMNGGNGATTEITGSSTTYAGGGGGAKYPAGTSGNGTGGTGGGGAGNFGSNCGAPPFSPGVDGGANTGGGGGGTYCGPTLVGSGGSGVVIIRYKFQ
tara:strand:- start:2794 stop:4122 length:1329 start_codon:yes stop_codon:yes gene_type:complete